jgi:hypothetical protein
VVEKSFNTQHLAISEKSVYEPDPISLDLETENPPARVTLISQFLNHANFHDQFLEGWVAAQSYLAARSECW